MGPESHKSSTTNRAPSPNSDLVGVHDRMRRCLRAGGSVVMTVQFRCECLVGPALAENYF